MASITLKDIPPELHAQLKCEAERNFRSMSGEVLARLERSFTFDDHLSTGTVDRLIEEALASGPEGKFSRAKSDAARERARRQFAIRAKAQ